MQPAWHPCFGLPPRATMRVVHGLAGNLVVEFELASGEVAGRQAASFVENVDQDVGAVGRQTLAADGMVEQCLGKNSCRILKFVGVGDFYTGAAFVVDGDELYLLGAHHRAESAAAVAADLAVGVFDGDVGGGHLDFAGLADGDDADFLAHTRFECLDDGKIALADQFCFFLDSNAILADV